MFLTEEDLAKPETLGSLVAEEEEDEEFGVILPNGEINWECPCLGGMPQGPCGQEFKDAFSCFHYRCAGNNVTWVYWVRVVWECARYVGLTSQKEMSRAQVLLFLQHKLRLEEAVQVCVS